MPLFSSLSWLICSVPATYQGVSSLTSVALLFCPVRRSPIAVGEVLRRLTSKCAARSVLRKALEFLAPLQLGVGIPARCDAIVHAVANCLEDPSIPPENRFILLVDFSNAFNSIDHSALFREVRLHTPSISAWMECCYGAQPILHLSDHTILSSSGVQQGDPLGPLGFALPIVDRIRREVPGLLVNAWFLDDGTLCGSLERSGCIGSEGPPRGLLLNRSKSLIAAPANSSVDHPLLSNIPVTTDGFTLLGSPLGSVEFCLESALRRIEKLRDSLHKLGDLEDSQMETALLRSCLSLPKVAHLIRTCSPDVIQGALETFDGLMREAVSDLAGCSLSNWAWLKSSLPSSLGSLNIRHATLYAPAAFIGSFQQSESIISDILGHPAKAPQHLPNAISALARAAARPEWVSIESVDVPLRCHSLSRSVNEACFSLLLERAPDVRSKALALSSAISHARDWLNVVPSSALGLHLLDCEFQLCLRYWLGLQIFEDGAQCPCLPHRS